MNDKLTDAELSDLFSYCARLSRLVAPAAAAKYYGFTFDSAVSDTLDGLAMLYAGEIVPVSTAAEFKRDEFYGPVLQLMLDDIDQLLDNSWTE